MDYVNKEEMTAEVGGVVQTEESKAMHKLADDDSIPWIPVTERLPDESEKSCVLGRLDFKKKEKIVPHPMVLIEGVWHSANLGLPLGNGRDCVITHWKPMTDDIQ